MRFLAAALTFPVALVAASRCSPKRPIVFPTAEVADHTTASATSSSAIPEESFAHNGEQNGYQNMLYYTDWSIYQLQYNPQDMPASDLTHVLFAFADIEDDGTVVSADPWADEDKKLVSRNEVHGCVEQLFKLKQTNRNLKALMSIGGWTYSPKFKPAVTSPAWIRQFAKSAVALASNWGFDGLDIDWEYPETPAEARALVFLLKACREELDNLSERNGQDYHYFLTMAVNVNPRKSWLPLLEKMDSYLDSWHVMAYDYSGKWDSTSGYQANLYKNPANKESTKFSTDEGISKYIDGGVPAHKIILGLPLYGRSFLNTDGAGKPYRGVGGQAGTTPYNKLSLVASKVSLDDVAGAAYSYDPTTKEFISFDNVASTQLKAKYIMNKGLGGAFFWDAAGDKKGKESLVGTMAASLGKLTPAKNNLNYPESKFTSIKNAPQPS